MIHPAQYWIRFLLSRREHSFTEIEGMCQMVNLGGFDPEELRQVRQELMEDMPLPFRGSSKGHAPSMRFLKRQGIYEAWHRDRHMHHAVELLGASRVRSYLETLLLSPLKPQQAVIQIERTTGTEISVETYKLFGHYFWNSTALSATDWGEYLQRREVSHNDWLKLAVKARGPQGVQLLLWKTGMAGARHLDTGKMFKNLRNIAYFKALALEHTSPSVDDSIAFKNYTQSAKIAQEEVAASAAAVTDVLDSFRAFQMETVDTDTKTIEQLTDGGVGTLSEAAAVMSVEDKVDLEEY
jgi:hypothetical protein